MPVFYVTVTVCGLKFKQLVSGRECDYTREELVVIEKQCKHEIRLGLKKLGYVDVL